MMPDLPGSGWGAPGRALVGLGQSIASVGGDLADIAGGSAADPEADFNDKMIMLKTDNDVGLSEVQAQSTYSGTGDDYLTNRSEFYNTTTQDAISRISPRNQQKAAVFFEQRRGSFIEGAARFGGQRRQETLQTTIDEAVTTEYGKLATVPPEEFETQFKQTVVGVDAIIKNAPLPDTLKDKLAGQAAERGYQILNGMIEDPDTAPEIVPRILKMIEESGPEVKPVEAGPLQQVPGVIVDGEPSLPDQSQPAPVDATTVPGLPGSPSGPAPQKLGAADITPPQEQGSVVASSAPAATGIQPTITAYSPQRGGDTMEGGYAAARPGPDGKAEVRTLADVSAGRSQYITLAGDESQYGKTYTIPQITYRDAKGERVTLRNVKGVVHDTGSAFKGKGDQRFDIPVDRDLPSKSLGSQPFSKQQISFIPDDGSAPQDAPPVSGSAFEVAKSFVGSNERRDAQALSKFFSKTAGQNLDPRKTAWCAAFVNATLAANGQKGTDGLLAREFLKVGTPTKEPTQGDIVVLSRGNSSWQGHVGFYAGKDSKGNVLVLGGNQGDAVSVSAYPSSRVLGYRVPPKAGSPVPGVDGTQVASRSNLGAGDVAPEGGRAPNTIPGGQQQGGPVQVADASGQFVPQAATQAQPLKPQTWRSVDQQLKGLLIKNLGHIRQQEAQAARKAAQIAEEKTTIARKGAEREGLELLFSRKLTRQWVQDNGPLLSNESYSRLMGAVTPKASSTNPVIYTELLERADEKPEDVITEASDAYATGQLDQDSFERVYSKANKAMRAETKRPPWALEYRSMVKRAIRPEPGDKTEDNMKAYGDTLEKFDEFLDEQKAAGKEMDRKSVQAFAEQTVKEFKMDQVTIKRKALGMPRFSQVSREAMTIDEVDQAIKRTLEAAKSGKLRPEELSLEAANLRKWKETLEAEAVAKGEKIKPGMKPAPAKPQARPPQAPAGAEDLGGEPN
jgi:uncharacterized protein (TIGR02594 family)